MVFPATSLSIVSFVGMHKATIAINLDLETHKAALFTDSVASPSAITDTAYNVAPWNANEVPNGSGYTTGGVTVLNTTFAHISVGNCQWDMDDLIWVTSTFTCRGADYYAFALASQHIFFQNFQANFSPAGGTFTVQQPAGGPAAIDFGG